MEHSRTVEIVRAAVASARAPEPPMLGGEGRVLASRYTDPARLARERDVLFRRLPVPLAASSEIAAPGAVVVRELGGVSLLLVRGDDGVARGFKNSCRHRGTRLRADDGCTKAFVCPYHGWSYARSGALLHVPHSNAFPTLDRAAAALAEVRVEERHGFLWVAIDGGAPGARAHLGAIDDELAALRFDRHHVARRVVREQRGNWKMLIEAFLEGYHIRTLHRSTIYPFFLDGRSVAEREGPHVRHATARRAALEIKGAGAFDAAPLRELATFGYVLFPCTVLIAHPDWTSHVVVQPIAPDRFSWSHTQLVAEEPAGGEAREHFARSFSLIEEKVFQEEDLFAIAEMQAGLETGANDALLFGGLETPALWFHEAVDAALD